MKKLLLFFFLFCLAGSEGFSQAPAGGSNGNNSQSPGNQSRIQVRVELVNVLATVTDKKNRLITDLTKEDFRIFEDGRPNRSASSAVRPTSLYASGC